MTEQWVKYTTFSNIANIDVSRFGTDHKDAVIQRAYGFFITHLYPRNVINDDWNLFLSPVFPVEEIHGVQYARNRRADNRNQRKSKATTPGQEGLLFPVSPYKGSLRPPEPTEPKPAHFINQNQLTSSHDLCAAYKTSHLLGSVHVFNPPIPAGSYPSILLPNGSNPPLPTGPRPVFLNTNSTNLPPNYGKLIL